MQRKFFPATETTEAKSSTIFFTAPHFYNDHTQHDVSTSNTGFDVSTRRRSSPNNAYKVKIVVKAFQILFSQRVLETPTKAFLYCAVMETSPSTCRSAFCLAFRAATPDFICMIGCGVAQADAPTRFHS